MLVNFVGAPCSGKTTIAATVFASLKEAGLEAEFVTEKAREYIAKLRYRCAAAQIPFLLDDSHQRNIFHQQDEAQMYMSSVDSDTVVVCDSDPLLTLMYMKNPDIIPQNVVQGVVDGMGLLFYCPPIDNYQASGNRVHDRQFALDFDKRILPHYKKLAPETPLIPLPLGTVKQKADFVVSTIYRYQMGNPFHNVNGATTP